MATPFIVNGDARINGELSAETFVLPNASVTDASVSSSTNIDADKLEMMHKAETTFGVNQDVAPSADIKTIIYEATGAATVRRVNAKLHDTGTSTDVKFDLQKAAAGSTTYTTILSGTINFTDADTDNTVKAGSISSAALIAGDSLLLFMDFTSATGALGPFAWIEVDENPV